MTFLAMIIALSLHQVLRPGNPLQRDAWLYRWDSFVAGLITAPGLRVALVLAGVALLTGWVISVMHAWLFGLPELLLTAVLLVWSLGREDFHTALERYAARKDTDAPGASQALAGLWMPEEADDPHEQGEQGDHEEELRCLQRLSYAGFARWFAPLFFFLLAGPVAAVMYRVLAVLAAADRDSIYQRCLGWSDWAPARLLALSFALTGDFIAVSQRAPLRHLSDATPAARLLQDLASTACGERWGARALGELLYRSAGLWLLLICAWLILG
jgi:AmpE protein